MKGTKILSRKRGYAGNLDRRRSRSLAILAAAGVAVEVAVMRLRGYRVGANVVVSCRQGHLFTTIWVPGASLKSLRFGWWRFQYCPVGHHWSIVTPVREAELTEEAIRDAHQHRDIRVP